jgi:predicted phosphodiesterase
MAHTALQIGLTAGTHGLLRPEAVAALRGNDYIVHAGDIGDPPILHALANIAPVTAGCGNNDTGSWANALPPTAVLAVGEAPRSNRRWLISFRGVPSPP